MLVGVWKRRDCTDFSRFSEKAQNSQKEHHIHIRGKNLPYISIYAYSCMSKCIEHSCGTSPPPPPITYNMYIQGMLHIFAYKYLQNYIWYVMSNTYTHCYFLCLCVQRNRELEATEGLLKCGKSFGIRKVHVKNLK